MENDPLGRWPRRLLHVKTMTSCQWEPGNVYRGVCQPLYNAITYTWGRFAYFDKMERGYSRASYLPVDGITWQDDVPRMKSQFDAGQLGEIIYIAANSCDKPGDNTGRVEFIWLDIACINQSKIDGERVDEYYTEIGRQAKIFRGASYVFVWLHSFSSDQLSRHMQSLEDLMDRMTTEQYGTGSTETGREGWAIDIKASLDELTQDHWFTSLWTLQEAFLSSHAKILCADGWHKELNFLRLDNIGLFWNIIYGIVERSYVLGHSELQGLAEEITAKVGFLEAMRGQDFRVYLENEAGQGNSLFLLTASHHRTVRSDNINDKIYGIMQVYDLKLGKCSPHHRAGTEYSLEDLKDQLGAEILKRFPIASQLVVQSGNCPSDKAWRVNSDMTIPSVALHYWRVMVSQSFGALVSNPSARLVAEQNSRTGNLWVRFTGHASLLDSLLHHVNSAGESSKLLYFPTIQVELDESWNSKIRLERGVREANSCIQRLTWIRDTYRHRSPILLLLGRTCGTPIHGYRTQLDNCDWGVCLILFRASEYSRSYVRVGFMVWKFWWLRKLMEETGLALPLTCEEYLEGHGDDWQLEHGFF